MIYIFFLFTSLAFSNNFIIKENLDTSDVFIGDVLIWSVRVEGDSIKKIRYPLIENTSDSVLIKKQGFFKENDVIVGTFFELMVWDTGSYLTPIYQVDVLNKDSTENFSISTDRLSFSVSSILTDSSIKDFRPLKAPIPIKRIIPFRFIFFVLVIIISLIAFTLIFKKREKTIYIKEKYIEGKDPKNVALERLNSLQINGLTKDFYAELSHITREYIENTHFIRTLEMTTDEIADNRHLIQIDENQLELWIDFLQKADKVKYAKELFAVEKMNSDMEKILNWINKI
jgi:hypothetical protein